MQGSAGLLCLGHRRRRHGAGALRLGPSLSPAAHRPCRGRVCRRGLGGRHARDGLHHGIVELPLDSGLRRRRRAQHRERGDIRLAYDGYCGSNYLRHLARRRCPVPRVGASATAGPPPPPNCARSRFSFVWCWAFVRAALDRAQFACREVRSPRMARTSLP